MLQLALYYAHSTTTIRERFIVFFLLVKADNQYSYTYWSPPPPHVLVEPPFIKTSSYMSVDCIDVFTSYARIWVTRSSGHATWWERRRDQFLWNQLSHDQLLRKFNFSQDQLLFIEREYTVQLLLSSAQTAWESACTLQQAQLIELYARPPGCISRCGW